MEVGQRGAGEEKLPTEGLPEPDRWEAQPFYHLLAADRSSGFTQRVVVFAEKDVNRTDRTTSFYEGVDNPRLGLLNDILMTYCMYDFDLGETVLPPGDQPSLPVVFCCLDTMCPPPPPAGRLIPSVLTLRLRPGDERPAVPHPLRDGQRGGSVLVLRLLHGSDGEFGRVRSPRSAVSFVVWLLISSAVCVCEQHQNFEEQMQGMKTQLIQLSTLLRLLDLAFWNYLGADRSSGGGGAVCFLTASSRVSFLPLQSLKIPVTSISASAGC